MKRGTYKDRSGWAAYPNSRWEDPRLDTFDKVIAGWLMSHADGYVAEHVSRNVIAQRLGIDTARVTKSLNRLHALGIIEITAGDRGRLTIRPVVEVWEHDGAPIGIPPSDDPSDRVEFHPVTEGKTTQSEQLHLYTPEQQVEHHHPQTPATCERPPRRSMEPAIDVEALFEAFWRVYPKRVSKHDARKAFGKLVRDRVDMRAVGEGLRAWCAYWDARGEMQFVPYPATWLNRRQWETPPVVDAPRARGGDAVVDRVRRKTAFKRDHIARHGCDDTCAEVEWTRAQRDRTEPVDVSVVG